MVFNSKQLFQSGLGAVILAQSNCQARAYNVWLYAVLLVVSTNDWLCEAQDLEVEWLNSNSVFVYAFVKVLVLLLLLVLLLSGGWYCCSRQRWCWCC